MAINVGDIIFTSLMTDDGGFDSSFSILVMNPINAGETITFHSPELGGDSTFTFTVGIGGLLPGDFVRFKVQDTGPPTLVQDPSGGSVTPIAGASWNVFGGDNILASSGGSVLTGITNDGPTNWDDNLAVTGLDRTAIDAAVPPPVIDLNEFAGIGIDDNSIWVGGPIDIAAITDPKNWEMSNDDFNHDTGAIGSTTYASQDAATPQCFAPGTLIATETGEVAVEALKPGDRVRTADGRLVEVKWLWRHTAHKMRLGDRMVPVGIRAGALGPGVPHTDLIVTADHGMVLDGLLVNAAALVNGDGIRFLPLAGLPERVVFYHVEIDAHDALLANGAAAESFIDYAGRDSYDNYGAYLRAHGAETIIREMPLPRVSSARMLPPAIKARLASVAGDDPVPAAQVA